MKILRLTLCNLASLVGEQTLDYRAEPLASAGLMAITGPTGSGKSTILDAMCLALFGQVPRLRSASKGQEGRVPDGVENESLTMHDPRTLLRRGAAEGYAEVEFVGQDGRIYSANWQVRRARNKSTGNLLAATRVLKDISSGQTLTNQVRECDAQISLLIGLNFEQFTRAVMLAQSEFGAFLKATDVERAQLLERLLETDIYRRLGEFAFEKRKTYQETYQQIKNQIGDLIPLEPDARQALEVSLKTLDQQQNDLASRQSYLLALRDWYGKKTQLHTQLNESINAVQQMETHWLSLVPLVKKIEQLEQLAAIRPVIERQQILNQNINRNKIDLAEQIERLDTAKNQRAIDQAEYIAAETKLVQAQKMQTESRPKISLAQGLEQEVSRLNRENIRVLQQIDAQKIQCKARQNELIHHQQLQSDLTRQLQLIGEQLNDTENFAALDEQWSMHFDRMREAEKINQELTQLSQNLPQLQTDALQAAAEFQQANRVLEQHRQAYGSNIEKNKKLALLRQQHASSRQADSDLRTLAQKYHDYQNTWKIIVELQTKQTTHTMRAEQLGKNRISVQHEIQTAELELNALLKILNQQRLFRTKNVEALRSQLQPDQPCPVCGSTKHPFSVAEHLLDAMNNDDEQQEKSARDKLTTKQSQLNSIETEFKILSEEIHDLHIELNRHRMDEKTKKLALKQITFADELRVQASDARAEWLTQKISQINQAERDLQHQMNELEPLISAEIMLLQQADQARFKHQQCQQIVQSAQSHQVQLTERLAQTEHYFLPYFDQELQQQWHDDRPQTMAHLQLEMTARLAQKSAQKSQQELLNKRQLESQLLQQKHVQEVEKQTDLEQQYQTLITDLSDQQARLTQILEAASDTLLSSIHTVLDWQNQLETRRTDAQHTVNGLQEQVNLQDNQIQKITISIEYLEQQLKNDEQEIHKVTTRINDWSRTHPTLSHHDFDALLAVTTIEEQQLKAQIEHAKHRLIEVKARLIEHEKQLEAHRQNQPVFLIENLPEAPLEESELVTAIEANAQHFEEAQREWMSLQFHLKQDDECKTKSNALHIELQKAEAEYHRIDRMASPIASKDGKVFQKIAQAYFLDRLLEDTNQQLGQLTQRYQLERAADSLGLLVIDSDMGDERRSVHSLSGGESFLVSLALALGLAAMASGRLRIESLFIDEGFGTLDPESLQVVMDALDRLQSQGRKVTVITHVQEMHERIPIQIQVQKMGNGQSKIIVV